MSGTIDTLSNILTNQYPDNTSQLIAPVNGRNGLESIAALFLRRRTLTAGNYTATFADRATTMKINSGTNATVTIAAGVFSANQAFGVLQEGTGTVTLLGSGGVTFQPAGLGPSTRAQGSLIYIVADPDVANQFWVFGDVV